MLNPCGTWAAAGELSWGVQAAAPPVPTTYIGREGGVNEGSMDKRSRRRARVLIVEGGKLPVGGCWN